MTVSAEQAADGGGPSGPGGPGEDFAGSVAAAMTTAIGSHSVAELVDVLDLERIDLDIFRGHSPAISPVRVFGGQVAGQALVAAGRTVEPDRAVHSLHSYFIRGGDPSVPIVYTVDRVRDGRSFTTRRVVAIQHGKAIFSLSASFQLAGATGLDHQSPMPASPPPESLPGRLSTKGLALELRAVPADADGVADGTADGPADGAADGAHASRYLTWMKTTARLPDNPLLHACVLTFASDLTQLDTILKHHQIVSHEHVGPMASLDHAVWFHRPFRADDWLLYEQESPSASGGRGLSIGRVFAEDGRHVATVMQEGLIRPRR